MLSKTELIIFILLCVAFAYQFYYYLRYFYSVINKKNETHYFDVDTQPLPPVSIIISAKNEVAQLRKNLSAIIAQAYPTFEIIVINEDSTDETENYLRQLCKEHNNVRTSFVPKDTNKIDTKKLALTLGIKAAKYDLLLFTDANCIPVSTQWLLNIARNFTPNIHFVLGCANFHHEKTFFNQFVRYDNLCTTLQYTGMAMNKKTYATTGRNVAYRKNMFFDNKGFGPFLQLLPTSGGLFINILEKEMHTRVETSPESIIQTDTPLNFKEWFFQKEEHYLTPSLGSFSWKWRRWGEIVFRSFFYGSLLATILLGNTMTIFIAFALLLIKYITQWFVVEHFAKKIGDTERYFFAPLLFDIYLLLLPLYCISIHRIFFYRKNKNL